MSNNALEYATQLALQAGQLLLGFFHASSRKASLKQDRTVVTEADIAADRLITAAIRQAFPDEFIVSEESQPIYLDAQQNSTGWILDPLDGTTNFHLGLHIWGVLITRLVDGLPETSVQYFPLVDELYTAQQGCGAFLNGRAIRVLPPDQQQPYSFFACCSRTFRHYQVNIPYKTRILGSSAYTFCSVARGVAVIGFEATPKVWDLAASWLLVKEAGGYIESLGGSQPFPLRSEISYASQNFPAIAAATLELMQRARQQIVPKTAL